LLSELANLCAAAVEHIGPHGRPEPAIRACAEGLAAVGQARCSVLRPAPVESTLLAARVGNRLGLDPGALIELELAACVQDLAGTKRFSRRQPVLEGRSTST